MAMLDGVDAEALLLNGVKVGPQDGRDFGFTANL